MATVALKAERKRQVRERNRWLAGSPTTVGNQLARCKMLRDYRR
ncbi:MAG TPA: hypothetical protein V6D50_26840 [Chroococcales cyanobacterium]